LSPNSNNNAVISEEDEDAISESRSIPESPTESPPASKGSFKHRNNKFNVSRKNRSVERWPLITIENDLDESVEPVIEYLDDLMFSNQSSLSLSQYEVCPCKGASNYDGEQRLLSSGLDFISECGPWCKCPMDCSNRVAQKKRSIPLILQRIKDYGEIRWAVKAQELIPKGTFIDQYFGEVITAREAMKRAMKYSEVRDNVILSASGFCSDTLLTLYSLHGIRRKK
jgi:hypothetical protein